jgi:hypothetical protein
MKLRKLRKLNNGCYSLYDSDGDIVASNNPDTPCSKKLSKQNCDEIFGVVDVEKLAYKTYGPETFVNHSDMYKYLCIKFFKEGFNKAMELNKDKLFTLEQFKQAIVWGYDRSTENIYLSRLPIDEFIQSLQQPKEIEVEIVVHVDLAATPTDSRHPDAYLGTDTGIPFLDENGCLILKKK